MSFLRRKPPVSFSSKVRIIERYKKVSIVLAEERDDNFITLQDGQDYVVKYLNDRSTGNKGSHSIVLRLLNPDNESDTPLILKICSYSTLSEKDMNIKKLFKREVIALKKAREARCRRVITIIESGELFINGMPHDYYVMEYATNDLSNYLLSSKVAFSQKVLICYDLLIGLQELHEIGVYHRDIKHDNLLMCRNECKLADLGLAKFQNDIDPELTKRLGAYGWEAPEAINKYYVEREELPADYEAKDDCIVDKKSDIYQIGKVFWYIFNQRIPVGQVVLEDFVINPSDSTYSAALFETIHGMLLQNKNKRTSIDDAIKVFKPLANRL